MFFPFHEMLHRRVTDVANSVTRAAKEERYCSLLELADRVSHLHLVACNERLDARRLRRCALVREKANQHHGARGNKRLNRAQTVHSDGSAQMLNRPPTPKLVGLALS